MTDTSLQANLDELARRVMAGTTIKAVYTITGTEADDGSMRPIPPSIDSTPVAILWFREDAVSAGNSEVALDRVDLLIFEHATGEGYGYSLLVPYIDVLKALFRTDMDNGGRATRVLYRGAGEIYPERLDNGQTYLVLPAHLEITRLYFSSDYAV